MVELKQNAYAQSQSTAIDAGLREYMMKVYNYMTSGLAISGLVAWGFSQSPALMGAIYGTGLQWVVMLAPLGFIFPASRHSLVSGNSTWRSSTM